MTQANRFSIFLIVFFVLCHVQKGYAQKISDTRWLQSNDRGNRFEGTYSKTISNPAIELVSFWAGFEPYEFGADQELKVSFRLPDTNQFVIKAEEIRTQAFYWMQNKQEDFRTGWNEFGPWPVDFMLKQFAIQPSNLGIIIRADATDLPTYVPAYAYHSADAKEPDFMAIVFRLGISITAGTVNIYQGRIEAGKNPDPDKLIHTQTLGKKFSGSSLPIRIDKKIFSKSETWYSLILTLQKRNSTDKVIHAMTFYYEPGE